MKNFYSRSLNFIDNTEFLAPFLGGYSRAAAYIIRSRGQNTYLQQGIYKNLQFNFRRCDLSAIKEILAKEEYIDLLDDVMGYKKNPVIYDIGAHIGLFGIWVFSNKPDAQIYSIEASPSTYKILEANTKMQNFSWQVQNMAAWGVKEILRFDDSLDSSMSHKISNKGNIEVPTITLTEVASNKVIDLMKVDIEGAEESFLTIESSALKNVRNLVMELHPDLCNAQNVMRTLEKNFKFIKNIKRGPGKPVLYCKN